MADEFWSFLWGGIDELMARLSRAADDVDRTTREAVIGAAAIVERAAKSNFEGSHPAGAPHVGGGQPNVETGQLRRSIQTTPVESGGPGRYRLRVAPTTIYARRVELGYPGGRGPGHQHTRAFPFFRPAVEDNRDKIDRYAQHVFGKIGER